jgi:hypothetical protein
MPALHKRPVQPCGWSHVATGQCLELVSQFGRDREVRCGHCGWFLVETGEATHDVHGEPLTGTKDDPNG